MTADRTLAERARELAGTIAWSGANGRDVGELLIALADENDTLRRMIQADIEHPAHMTYAGRLVPINSTGMRGVVDEASRLRAERARYWNLAVQLAEALRSQMTEVGPSVTDMFEAAAALDAFQAERKSRDV